MKRKSIAFYFAYGLLISLQLNAQTVFKDISHSSQIDHTESHSGIAVADFDNDGKEDVYLSVRDGVNKLFRNLGDEYFIELSESTGVDCSFGSRTSIFFDLNNDGWQDLYVGNYGSPDLLYVNRGDGTFQDITIQAGINNWGWPLSVNIADINNDGYLDIYVSNSVMENVLYRNNGNNTFTNIIYASNATDPQISMGSLFFDYDKDGDQDLYLVHDSNQANILYQNNGQGYFTDVSVEAGVNYRGLGMGVDAGDINNDGWLDLYVTNLFENALFLNNGDGTFQDITAQTQVDDYGMGWGTNIFDYNNDGLLDIYVANDSHFSSAPNPNILYENKGNLSFEPLGEEEPVCSRQGSYGSVTFDIDLDGRLDIAIANAGTNNYTQLFHNQHPDPGNWVAFLLEGKSSNRNAVGARIELMDDRGILHISEVKAGSGYASQSSFIQHFGIGEAESFEQMKIYWPSGMEQDISPVQIDNHYMIKEGEEPKLLNDTASDITELDFKYFQLFPNPSSGIFQLEFELPEDEVLALFVINNDGSIAKMIDLHQRDYDGRIKELLDLRNMPQGVYTLLIRSHSGIASEKLVILK